MTGLPPNQQLIRGDRWPVVGESLPVPNSDPWSIRVTGSSDGEYTYSLDELATMPWIERSVDIHCVTRWSRLGVTFRGLPLETLVPVSKVPPETRFISMVARSPRNHSTSLPVADLFAANALVAFEVDGAALPQEHGGPVRMVVPGRYFYKSVKWLERIDLLVDDRLGHWEAEAGYHNGADPWQEQRYVASNVSKQQIAGLVSRRDFRNLDLLSLQMAGHDLSGLQAQRAQLRNAGFQGAILKSADFSAANLSNAKFCGANLQDAVLRDADIEGADFAAADLRGADLRVASMFGASFCRVSDAGEITEAAIMDRTTLIDESIVRCLVDDQQQFLQSRLVAARVT